jgi:hypothetical protein
MAFLIENSLKMVRVIMVFEKLNNGTSIVPSIIKFLNDANILKK